MAKILETARSVIHEKLQGSGSEVLIDTELESLRSGWVKGLDSPYHSVMAAPLNEADLQVVFAAIREKAQPHETMNVATADLQDAKLLSAKGVPALFSAVREACALMTKFSYKGQPDYSAIEDQWKARAQLKVQELLNQEAGTSVPSAKTAVTDKPTPGAVQPRHAGESPVSRPAVAGQSESQSNAGRTSVPQSAGNQLSRALLLTLVIVLVILGVVVVSKSVKRRGSGV